MSYFVVMQLFFVYTKRGNEICEHLQKGVINVEKGNYFFSLRDLRIFCEKISVTYGFSYTGIS